MESMGLARGTITPELRSRFALDEATKGVVITVVKEGSASADKGLQAGDVIVEVDQEEVSTPAEVVEKVDRAKSEGYRVVTLLVRSEEHTSELQSLMRTSYAVFCLKKKKTKHDYHKTNRPNDSNLHDKDQTYHRN